MPIFSEYDKEIMETANEALSMSWAIYEAWLGCVIHWHNSAFRLSR